MREALPTALHAVPAHVRHLVRGSSDGYSTWGLRRRCCENHRQSWQRRSPRVGPVCSQAHPRLRCIVAALFLGTWGRGAGLGVEAWLGMSSSSQPCRRPRQFLGWEWAWGCGPRRIPVPRAVPLPSPTPSSQTQFGGSLPWSSCVGVRQLWVTTLGTHFSICVSLTFCFLIFKMSG